MEKQLLKEMINLSGLSQKDFSIKVNVPEPRISEWLKGKRKIKLSTILDMSEKLECKIEFKITC